jgi:hypothetical protein
MINPKTNDHLLEASAHYNYVAQENELSLVDLIISLRVYKKRVFGVFFIIFVLALLALFLLNKQTYSLVSTLQIGTRKVDNTIIPIESPESLLSKINSSILPSYTMTWTEENNIEYMIETNSSNPKNSNIILITNKCSEKNIDLLADFQHGLVGLILRDHRSLIYPLKAGVESDLRLAKVELDHLNDPLTLNYKIKEAKIELEVEEVKLKKLEDERFFGIQKSEFQSGILKAQHERKRLADLEQGLLDQYKRVEEGKKILSEKINELKVQISNAKDNLRPAATDATELSAMSQLLIANEIQQNQNLLGEFEQRYYVTLENKKSSLMQEVESVRLKQIEMKNEIDLLKDKYKALLEENQLMREQQRHKVDETTVKLDQIQLSHKVAASIQEEKVRELTGRLNNFSETRAVSTAVKSLRPSGLSPIQLVILSLILALVASFAAALFLMLIDKVKRRLAEQAVG